MKIYNIDPEEYFQNIYPDNNYEGGFIEVADSMFQMIYHFNLQNKKVLSIGSGYGLQEFWFYKKGCRLTLIDIDEKDLFIPYLNKMKLEGSMTYIIGDIRDLVKELSEKYDVIYTSGLISYLLWNENGFSDIIFECIRKFLDSGLFICQSYHEGLKMDDLVSISMIKEQCEREGLYLVSIYHFYPSHTHVSLITIFKGTEVEFEQYMKDIKGNIKIERFHGRSKMKIKVKKAYQYE